ncbi:MAG: hypothetical protein IGS39_22050 [Calothrix sp. C42_A2020_038]|nr:hypothetical protein [Calothrix sp. C42_A2020_038]
MQTEPNNLPEAGVTSTDTVKQHKLLIPRNHRRKFFLSFVLMTIVGWVVGGIASLAIERAVNEQLIPKTTPETQLLWYAWGTYLSLIIFALIFAIDQALAIRRYISFWWWLLATSFGWLASIKVSNAWTTYIQTFGNSLNRDLTSEESIILTIASTLAYILSGIWISFCQWIVLRRYTQRSWWWNFVNSFAFLVISFLLWSFSLIQHLISEAYRPLISYLSEQGLTALVLGIIPAIAFCRLQVNVRK